MRLTTHQRDAVVGVDACEDLVDHGDVRAVGGHKAADVCHVHDERDLRPSSTRPHGRPSAKRNRGRAAGRGERACTRACFR